MSSTPAQQRERAISEVPDEQCPDLLTEAETLLAGVENQPPPEAPPVFNQATALVDYALAVDRIKQSVPDEAAHRRLDWAMQRTLVNPWRLEGCCHDDIIKHELEEIASDEELFADHTPEALLASEQRLARVIDFEHATFADYIALFDEECSYDLLINECMDLLFDSGLEPILKRLLRVLVSAPLFYRATVAAICDPRGGRTLTDEDFAEINETLWRREVPERGADSNEPGSPHIH
jgi:hypothetical protein